MTNKPLAYSDPSGHRCNPDDGCQTPHGDLGSGGGSGGTPGEPNPDDDLKHDNSCDTNGDGHPDIPCPGLYTRDFWDFYRANAYDATCPDWVTLVACYYAHGSLSMGSGTMYISAEEFNNLMLAIYYEADGRNPADLIITSLNFDTPFYDLGRTGNALPGRACIEGLGCYARNEINYVAQGIVAAAAMQSREAGLLRVYAWKGLSARHAPSQGTIDMFNVGYDFYHAQNGSTPPAFNPPFLIPIPVSVNLAANP